MYVSYTYKLYISGITEDIAKQKKTILLHLERPFKYAFYFIGTLSNRKRL